MFTGCKMILQTWNQDYNRSFLGGGLIKSPVIPWLLLPQMAFIIVAGICACLYFLFLCFMVFQVFRNISGKRMSLPAMSKARRLHYEVGIFTIKFCLNHCHIANSSPSSPCRVSFSGSSSWCLSRWPALQWPSSSLSSVRWEALCNECSQLRGLYFRFFDALIYFEKFFKLYSSFLKFFVYCMLNFQFLLNLNSNFEVLRLLKHIFFFLSECRWMMAPGTGETTQCRWTVLSSLASTACGTCMSSPLCSFMRLLTNAMETSSQVHSASLVSAFFYWLSNDIQ